MSRIEESVEAGADAAAEVRDAYPRLCDDADSAEVASAVLSAAWPVLSAGLRELHRPVWACGNPGHTNPDVGCPECDEVCRTCTDHMPCPTVRELDRIDRALGIGGES